MVHALRVVLRQEATGESVELAYVDRGYTGEEASADTKVKGIRLEVVKHPGAKKASYSCRAGGSWSVPSCGHTGSGGWPRTTSAATDGSGAAFVAFACLFLHRVITVLGPRP
jgi:hypothetical protein